jgi:hypothetical protein
MKPSKFKRIEKNALKQRDFISDKIKKSIIIKDNQGIKENKECLSNLVSTMRDLKK